MRKILAIILGVEIGLVCWFFLFSTLVIYVVTGIIGYWITCLFPVNFETVQAVLTTFSAILTVGLAIFLCWSTIDKHYKTFKVLSMIIPVAALIAYFVLF